jgi:rhodanese-related sulfurtransferase
VASPFVAYLLWRAWELLRMMGHLRIRSISPVLLRQKLALGEKVALLDLLLFDAEEENSRIPGIPGAIRIDPARLRSSRAKVRVPRNVEIVLCCSSSNEITGARVAVSLRHKGISKVWVLEGGLEAWKKLNFPLTSELGNPKEIAARFGIEVIEQAHES